VSEVEVLAAEIDAARIDYAWTPHAMAQRLIDAGWTRPATRGEWGVRMLLQSGRTWTLRYGSRAEAERQVRRDPERRTLVRRRRTPEAATEWEEVA
jgi:hypothetical protein